MMPWILSIIGLTGFFLAGKKIWWCWYINIANQILWFVYSITTEQYGFIVAAFFYTFIFVKNAYHWTKEHKSDSNVILDVENSDDGLVCMDRKELVASYLGVIKSLRKHFYISTYCLHELHDDCRLNCKTCEEPCMCDCHFTEKLL